MGNPNPAVELNGSSCANCSCILNGDINRPKIYNLNILICMPKESADLMSCESVSVISALRDLYSDSFELYGQQRQTGSSKASNNESVDGIPLCVPCSLILQDLYRSYRLFKSVRKDSSYIAHITHSDQSQSDNIISRDSPPDNIINTVQSSNADNCTNSGGNQTDTPGRRPRQKDVWRFETIPNQTVSMEPVPIKFEINDDDIMMDDLAAPELHPYPAPTETKRLRQLEQSIENSILGIAAEVTDSDECGVKCETNQRTGVATDHGPPGTNVNYGSSNCSPSKLAEVSWVVQKNCDEEEYRKNCSTSQREGKVLWHEGYPFTIQKRLPSGNLRYICRRRRGLKCSGALMLYTTGIQALTVKHEPPHEAILVEKDIDLYRQLLKQRSLSHPSDSPKDVVAHVLSQFPPSVAQELSQSKVPTGYYVRQIRQKKSIQLGQSFGLLSMPTSSSLLMHQKQLLLSPPASSGNDEISESTGTETNSTTSGA